MNETSEAIDVERERLNRAADALLTFNIAWDNANVEGTQATSERAAIVSRLTLLLANIVNDLAGGFDVRDAGELIDIYPALKAADEFRELIGTLREFVARV
jgi:hypothetical protein